jgi:hypothetical protein
MSPNIAYSEVFCSWDCYAPYVGTTNNHNAYFMEVITKNKALNHQHKFMELKLYFRKALN